MNSVPELSNDIVGSQQASPRLSPLPINVLAQLLPPSKLTPLNIPAAGKSTLVMTTMLFGFVGLTAMAPSDSLWCHWLASTFVGIPLPVGFPDAAAELVTSPTVARAATSAAVSVPLDIASLL